MKKIVLPLLKNHQDFESFCLEFFNIKYETKDFRKYGRSWQAQDGIDFFQLLKTY